MQWFPDDNIGYMIEVTVTGYYLTGRNSIAIHIAEMQRIFGILGT